MEEQERCFKCDNLTGKSGQSEDSFYDEFGYGPYCESCYDKTPEMVKATVADLEATVTRQREALHEVREIYTGMDGVPEPETAVESYLLKVIKDMYNAALKEAP